MFLDDVKCVSKICDDLSENLPKKIQEKPLNITTSISENVNIWWVFFVFRYIELDLGLVLTDFFNVTVNHQRT